MRIDLATLAPVPDFALPAARAADVFPHGAVKVRAVAARLNQPWRLTHGFLGRITRDLCEGLVDPQDHVVGVGHHHAFKRVKGDSGDAQFGLGLLAVGDVAPAGAKAREHPFGILDRNPGRGQPEHGTILAHTAELQVIATQTLQPFLQLGRDTRQVFWMNQRAREIGHGQALLHGIARIVLDRGVDPARPSVQPPPNFQVDGAVGDGAELFLALAQFPGHGGSETNGTVAPGGHEPGKQGQQQAQARAGDGDQRLSAAADAVLEFILGTHGKQPGAPRDDQVLIGRHGAAAGARSVTRGRIEQRAG